VKTSLKLAVLSSVLLGLGALALPASADDDNERIPEPPKQKTMLMPLNQPFSQFLDDGYQITAFQFENNDAAFVIVRNGHNVLCMVGNDGKSQCIGLNAGPK